MMDTMIKPCKYYHPHMETIKEYVYCLYSLEGCNCGGMLHILLDDNNINDDDIIYCLKEFLSHPEREESKIGVLICEEYLKLSIEQRILLINLLSDSSHTCIYCITKGDCEKCPMIHNTP